MNDEDLFRCFPLPSSCITTILDRTSINPKICNLSATLLMNQEDCEQMEINRNGWFIVEMCIRKQNQILKLLKLIHIIRLHEIKCSEIMISNEMLYNLMNSLNSNCGKFKSSFALHIKNRTKLNHDFSPNIAYKATVCVIAYDPTIEREQLDIALMGYFQKPRYLCKGDVFVINMRKYIPEVSLDISKLNSTQVYFKVVEIEGQIYETVGLQNIGCGYAINKNTALYQVSSQQGYVPHYKYRYISDTADIDLRNIKQKYPPLLPSSFTPKFDVLLSWFQQFTTSEYQDLKLNPFFLLHGPQGVGKSLLLSSICTFIGIGYVKFSCNNCEGLAPGQGEGKIKALFAQVKERAPCILHLENVEALCYNADGDEDVRTLSCLNDLIETMKCDFPLVIVATTSNLEAVKPSLAQQFLQTLQVDAPNTVDRVDILQWISHCWNYKFNIELLQQIATLTAGFLLTDLLELVALAYRERMKKLKYSSNKIYEHPEEIQFEMDDFTSVIGTMQSAFSESIGAPKIPDVKWEDVGGLASLKEEILCSLRSTQWDTELKRSGLLLHGPPGTGKTLLAKAVATECGRNFLSVKGPELLNMYVGQSEQNIRRVFEVARTASPCIIFFDELDSLAPNRGRSGDSGGVMDRVVSQLLAEMDGMSSSGDVFILAATNRPDLIDPAIRRPGRLDKMLYVGPCSDRESQISVFKALTRKFKMAAEVDIPSITDMIPESVTGADIYAVCSAAWVNAARRVIQCIEDQNSNVDEKKREVIVQQDDFVIAVTSCKYSTKL